MALDLSKLNKLTIRPEGEGEDSFEAMFNPSNFSFSHGNRYTENQRANNPSESNVNFNGRSFSTLNTTLILDDTGVTNVGLVSVFGLYLKSVAERVAAFMNLCLNPQEDTHTPKTVIISWGEAIQNFTCRLKSVDVNYTLFDRDGMPLRAELRTSFIGVEGENGRLFRFSSPDLTHSRIIKAGDTLPILTKEIYGTSSFYLKVAEVNALDDFRDLVPGQKLFFPPLEK